MGAWPLKPHDQDDVRSGQGSQQLVRQPSISIVIYDWIDSWPAFCRLVSQRLNR
jgi:hypothetical protein